MQLPAVISCAITCLCCDCAFYRRYLQYLFEKPWRQRHVRGHWFTMLKDVLPDLVMELFEVSKCFKILITCQSYNDDDGGPFLVAFRFKLVQGTLWMHVASSKFVLRNVHWPRECASTALLLSARWMCGEGCVYVLSMCWLRRNLCAVKAVLEKQFETIWYSWWFWKYNKGDLLKNNINVITFFIREKSHNDLNWNSILKNHIFPLPSTVAVHSTYLGMVQAVEWLQGLPLTTTTMPQLLLVVSPLQYLSHPPLGWWGCTDWLWFAVMFTLRAGRSEWWSWGARAAKTCDSKSSCGREKGVVSASTGAGSD